MSGKPVLETSKGMESMDDEEISAAPLNSTFNSEDTQEVASLTCINRQTCGHPPNFLFLRLDIAPLNYLVSFILIIIRFVTG